MIMSYVEGNDSDADGTLQTNTGADIDSSKSAPSAQVTDPSTAAGTSVSSTQLSATPMKKGMCTRYLLQLCRTHTRHVL